MLSRHVPLDLRSSVLVACLMPVLGGCMAESISQGSNLTEADRAAIEEEVRQALDDYATAIVSGDSDRIKAFWGDFEDFVHAGDGRVMGDRDTWFAWMDANPGEGEIVSWDFSDIHVAVLAPDAASYTANFRNVAMDSGTESITTGSWTYVLRKTDDGWRVVHSNGKHNEFSYYDTQQEDKDAALSAFYTALREAAQAADTQAYTELYVPDGMAFFPNRPALRGRAEIGAWVDDFRESWMLVLDGPEVELKKEILGDVATRSYRQNGAYVSQKTGERLSFNQKYLDMLRYEDSEWRMIYHIASSNTFEPGLWSSNWEAE